MDGEKGKFSSMDTTTDTQDQSKDVTKDATKGLADVHQRVQTMTDLAHYGLIMVLIVGLICYFDSRIPEYISNIFLVLLPVMAFSITATVVICMKNT